MPRSTSPSRDRLLEAAIELFTHQGLAETTTRQIADRAGVNEVTLFRQFNSKYGLLLALLQDERKLQQWLDAVPAIASSNTDLSSALRNCARDRVACMLETPALLRSAIGEADSFSPETQAAMGTWLHALNRRTEAELHAAIASSSLLLSASQLVRLLNALSVGYAAIALTTSTHSDASTLETFADAIAILFAPAIATEPANSPRSISPPVDDLPAHTVRALMVQAKSLGAQDYALAYLALGAGIRVTEMTLLKRSHDLSNARQHVLAIPALPPRQVPVNRWIMEHRYGSYARNPVTQWLKNRKDEQESLFLNDGTEPATEPDLRERWHAIADGLATVSGEAIAIERARDTWLVDMLVKGMSLDNLSILSGASVSELAPYERRAKEKVALANALDIDQKRSV